ncbi:cell division protein FtsA [Clostridiisalibacter paucivorans]|uniref:cell division protein FtsA n=1 Tax=Clostridiisalibacter paucivorans TaxID=408753 RepID=UPI000478F4CC|nr:cell division protein FtsA [Clostridiisalibacter paucivorans]
MDQLIASVDIGTSKVCVAALGTEKNGQVHLVGMGKSECKGVKKGVVVDIEETSRAIIEALNQAENMSDLEITQAYINMPGGYCNIINNRGVIAVSSDNREIDFEDIKRVLNSATILSIPQDQKIIDIIPNQYIVDGYDEIKDPTGMVGMRLEVDSDIITSSTTTVLNAVKSANKAGLEVLGIIMEPLAISHSTLTSDEMELGILTIDIGAGTTDVSLFKNNRIIYSEIIPVGGNHITNDISVGLRISFKDSERIKRKYGMAYANDCDENTLIEIKPIGKEEIDKVNLLDVSVIIEARVREILEMVFENIRRRRLTGELLTGIVITGGGVSYLKGIKKIGEEIFKMPVRLGHPEEIGVKEPIYSTAIGIVNYVLKRKFNYYIEYNNIENNKNRFKSKKSNNVSSFFKKLWNDYF